MLRNSMLYRRWRYVKKRNLARIRVLVRLAMAFAITCVAALLMRSDLPHVLDVLGLPGLVP